MSDKLIGYTTRFNAFWKTSPTGWKAFNSNGEGIDISNKIEKLGSSLDNVVDWVNIMFYDATPTELGCPTGEKINLDSYKLVLDAFKAYVPKNKIIMGFEPGSQAAGGEWEGKVVDKQVIDYLKANSYGGIMFWAINHVTDPIDGVNTGDNAQDLAEYANATHL